MPGKYLTTFEASRILGVSLPTVVNWIKAHRIKAHKTPGGHRRIAREDLLAFLKRYQMPVPGELEAGDDAKLRVLSVDDDADERELVRARLEPAGFAVETASSGFEAGLLVRTFRPDAVLLDLMMPGMDGFAAIAALRRLDETADVPVIACTARADEEAARRIVQAGFAAHLVKPYPGEALVGELLRLLRPPEPRVARRGR